MVGQWAKPSDEMRFKSTGVSGERREWSGLALRSKEAL